MAGLEDIIRSSAPGGNIGKPLMLALLALLASGALFGGGVAYELSPSWDIRAEYRGFLVKTPNFSLPNGIFNTNRYEVISTPAIGVAYHF